MGERQGPQKKDLAYHIKDNAMGLIAWPLAKLILRDRNMPVFESMFDVDMSSEIEQALIEYAAAGFDDIIMYSKHNSQSEAFALHFATKRVRRIFDKNGMRIISAKSMEKEQGKAVAIFDREGSRLMARHEQYKVGVIRESDRDNYGMKGDNDEAIEEIFNSAKDNLILGVFPEGSLKGARKKDDAGNVYGLQCPDDDTKRLLKLYGWQNKRKILYIPLIMENTEEIFTPEGKFITKKFLNELFVRQNPNHGRPPFARVKFLDPFTYQDIIEQGVDTKNAEQVSEFLCSRIARKLRIEQRGDFQFSYYTYRVEEEQS